MGPFCYQASAAARHAPTIGDQPRPHPRFARIAGIVTVPKAPIMIPVPHLPKSRESSPSPFGTDLPGWGIIPMDPRGGSHRGFRALPASQRAGFIFTFKPTSRAHTAPCQIELIELANAINTHWQTVTFKIKGTTSIR